MIFLLHPDIDAGDRYRRTLAFRPDRSHVPIAKAVSEGGNECFIQHAQDGDYIVDRIRNEDYPAPIVRCRRLLTDSGNGFECPQLKEEEIVIFLNEISSLAYAFIKGDSELILQFARSENELH